MSLFVHARLGFDNGGLARPGHIKFISQIRSYIVTFVSPAS